MRKLSGEHQKELPAQLLLCSNTHWGERKSSHRLWQLLGYVQAEDTYTGLGGGWARTTEVSAVLTHHNGGAGLDRIQILLMLRGERPCWPPLLVPLKSLPSAVVEVVGMNDLRLGAINHHLKLNKVALRQWERGETLYPDWGVHVDNTTLQSTGKSIHKFLLAVSYNMVISSTT